MTTAIDRTLIQSAADGDPSSINLLLRTLRPRIERQLLRYPVSDEDRRDLLQTTLMQVVRRLPSFRGEAPFSTWLFRVTTNEALMMMRSHRRYRARMAEGFEPEQLDTLPAPGGGAFSQDADTSAARNERATRLQQALAELTQDYRDVVIAHYHLDLGLQEIATRLAMSEAAVRSRIYRARAQLRVLLEGTPLAAEAREEATLSSGPRRIRKRRRNRTAAPTVTKVVVTTVTIAEQDAAPNLDEAA
ncbi:MAG TPA: RNA polymerase sigma factor [Polyangiaceae bacterium]|nr:RNA polymerase sigma factor [Polyangiaceae bacterium]